MHTDRRSVLLSATALGLSALTAARAADRPSDKVRVAILGTRIRGKSLMGLFTQLPDVEIAAICDPDLNLIPAMLKQLPEKHTHKPAIVQDMRKVFEDRTIDAVANATPDHWHALGTIWALQSGKHVYTEKPLSHNIVEGRRMVEAAEKYKKVVQVGTQRRSAAYLAEAAAYVQSGKLGKVPFARTWIAGNRKTIGKKKDEAVPDKVDYDLWTGPAALRPFNRNRFHYEWHWNWDYGTGEIGNNGIHGLDLVRWLLALDAPRKISSAGGVFFFDDDRQTPDTQTVTYDFDKTTVVWEHRIWAKTGVRNQGFGVELIGEKGTLVVDDKGWHIEQGEEKAVKPTSGDLLHVRNFIDCIKTAKLPNAPIEEGHKSTRLCHLGNIAHRTGRTIKFDPTKEAIVGDEEANALMGRAYRKGFEVPASV
ncbi:MAG: gfo/Idh/MocA family oxidoreductase [Planctomycetia bacterium]|nr:gfo/Idh/MocA family oxidoreductase [Planctomycetia bacterium]